MPSPQKKPRTSMAQSAQLLGLFLPELPEQTKGGLGWCGRAERGERAIWSTPATLLLLGAWFQWLLVVELCALVGPGNSVNLAGYVGNWTRSATNIWVSSERKPRTLNPWPFCFLSINLVPSKWLNHHQPFFISHVEGETCPDKTRVFWNLFYLVSLLKQSVSVSINTNDLMYLKTRIWLKSRKQRERGGSSSSHDDVNTVMSFKFSW